MAGRDAKRATNQKLLIHTGMPVGACHESQLGVCHARGMSLIHDIVIFGAIIVATLWADLDSVPSSSFLWVSFQGSSFDRFIVGCTAEIRKSSTDANNGGWRAVARGRQRVLVDLCSAHLPSR
eukprot:scaffold48091_cov21-Tisochrysis_lutea.AAC.1